MVDIFNGVGGFNCYSAIDAGEDVADIFTFEYIQQQLAAGNPIMIGWNDWGGHWQVIIGYDTMGTETTQDDVIIRRRPLRHHRPQSGWLWRVWRRALPVQLHVLQLLLRRVWGTE